MHWVGFEPTYYVVLHLHLQILLSPFELTGNILFQCIEYYFSSPGYTQWYVQITEITGVIAFLNIK